MHKNHSSSSKELDSNHPCNISGSNFQGQFSICRQSYNFPPVAQKEKLMIMHFKWFIEGKCNKRYRGYHCCMCVVNFAWSDQFKIGPSRINYFV